MIQHCWQKVKNGCSTYCTIWKGFEVVDGVNNRFFFHSLGFYVFFMCISGLNGWSYERETWSSEFIFCLNPYLQCAMWPRYRMTWLNVVWGGDEQKGEPSYTTQYNVLTERYYPMCVGFFYRIEGFMKLENTVIINVKRAEFRWLWVVNNILFEILSMSLKFIEINRVQSNGIKFSA